MPPWDAAAVRERARSAPTQAQQRALATERADYRRPAAHGARIALHTATLAPARLFGLDDDLGTVERAGSPTWRSSTATRSPTSTP
jgi:hypothetical protein